MHDTQPAETKNNYKSFVLKIPLLSLPLSLTHIRRLHPLMYGFYTYIHTYYIHSYLCTLRLLGVATKLEISFVEPSHFQFHSWKSQLLQRMTTWWNDKMGGEHTHTQTYLFCTQGPSVPSNLRRSLNWSFNGVTFRGVTQWKKLLQGVSSHLWLHLELCISTCECVCVHAYMHGYLRYAVYINLS